MSLLTVKHNDMKKMMTILAIAVTSLGFSQEKVGEYTVEFLKGKTFDISATEPKSSGKFTYYIDVFSRDNSVKSISLSIENNELDSFKKQLNAAKAKFVQWSNTAIANNVTELDKEMKDIKFKSSAAFLYGSKWKFCFSVRYKFRAKIIDGKMHLIITNKEEMVASSNQFMDCKGFALIFSSSDEIDAFMNQLDESKVIAHFSKKGNTEDLFQ